MTGSTSPDDSDPSETFFNLGFILALIVNSALAFIFYILITGVSLYAAEQFQVSEAAVGLASSAFVIGSLLARIFATRLLQMVNGKKILVSCLIIYVICSLAYILAQGLWSLVAIRMVHGLGFGFASSALSVQIFSQVPSSKRARAAGFYSMAYAIFPAIGPTVSLYLVKTIGYWAIFILCALLALLALVAALGIRFAKTPKQSRSTISLSGRIRLQDFYEPRVFGISVVVFIIGAANSGIITFLPIIAVEKDVQNYASLYFLAYSLGAVLSRMIFGWVQDKLGDNAASIPALLLFSAAPLCLFLANDLRLIPLAGIFAGLGFGALFPIMQAITVSLVPPGNISRALSTYYVMMDLGLSLGPIFLGAIYQKFGDSMMFLSILLSICTGAFLYLATHGRSTR